MRRVVASPFLSLDGAAEQSEEFVTFVDDAMEENLKESHDDDHDYGL